MNDEDGEKKEVKVLDVDTVSQVKEKILDSIYRNRPYSARQNAQQVDLGEFIEDCFITHRLLANIAFGWCQLILFYCQIMEQLFCERVIYIYWMLMRAIVKEKNWTDLRTIYYFPRPKVKGNYIIVSRSLRWNIFHSCPKKRKWVPHLGRLHKCLYYYFDQVDELWFKKINYFYNSRLNNVKGSYS